MPTYRRPPKLIVKRGGEYVVSTAALSGSFAPDGRIRNTAGRRGVPSLFELTHVAQLTAGELRQRLLEGRVRQDRFAELAALPERVPRELQRILSNGTATPPLYPQLVSHLARAAAVGVHATLHAAFDTGLRETPRGPAAALERSVDKIENRYRAQLRAAQRAARNGDPAAALRVHAAVVEHAHTALAHVCRLAARASAADDQSRIGLRASAIARRAAMLAAGTLLLDARLRNARTRAGTAAAARRAGRLLRPPLQLRGARTDLTTRDVGSRRSLAGRAARVQWIEQPRKPYSVVVLDGSGAVLLFPHKSMRGHGLGVGAAVWAAGTVKAGRFGLYLEVEFEGPGTHRNECWEDWLAVLARPVYDLHPATVLAEWELSGLDRVAGRIDLADRIS